MRRWLLLAALPQMAAHKPSELATLSIVRAHFCERLARCARIPEHNEAFLMGLFSLLDALIDRPLDEALSHVKLAPALTNALLGVSTEADPFSSLFQLVRCYEMADWGAVHRFAAQLQLPVSEVSEAYLDATRRADDMLSEVVN
jgi:EAL and modified HD-GYP domain-containing signal transduction protein